MTDAETRRDLLRRGLWLSIMVVLWNVVEGFVAVTAGLLASSLALLSFGVDSSIEVLSALVVTWRLRSELYDNRAARVAEIEKLAAPITGVLLLILAAYILLDAGRRLWGFGEEAETSWVGMALTAVSLVIMPMLGAAKLHLAKELESRSMRADAFETLACAWMSFTTLAGLALNAAFGWTWADPLAALLVLPWIVREGLEACYGEQDDE